MLTCNAKKSTCMPVIISSTLWAAAQPDSATVDSHSPHQARSCHPCIARSQPAARRLSSKTYQQRAANHTQEAQTCKHECTRIVRDRFRGGRLNNTAPNITPCIFCDSPEAGHSGFLITRQVCGKCPHHHWMASRRRYWKRKPTIRCISGQQGSPPTTRIFPAR